MLTLGLNAVREASNTSQNASPERKLHTGSRVTPSPEAVLEEQERKIDEIEDGDDEGSLYPTTPRLVVIILFLCIGSFLVNLDMVIVPIAIPNITDTFSSMNDVGWYASTNMLVLCAFIPIYGKIFAYFDEKWTFLTVLIILEIGSLISGLARSSAVFVLGRAIVGLGAAGVSVGCNIIIVHSTPLRRRAFLTSLVGSTYGLSSIAGPPLAGFFADSKHLTWRWCFLINVPIGLAAACAVLLLFKSPRLGKSVDVGVMHKLKKLDFLGMFFFVPSVICLLYALQIGGTRFSWGNLRVIMLLIVSFLCATIFVALQVIRGDLSTIPPRIFKERSIWTSFLFTFFLSGSFFLLLYYLPMWFQAIQSATAFQSGIRNMPQKLSVMVTTLLAGVIVSVWGYYKFFMVVSAAMLTIASGLLTTLSKESGQRQWIGYQLFAGFAYGLGQQMGIFAAHTVLKRRDAPIGIAVIMFSQQLGASVTISIGQSVFYNRLIGGLSRNVPRLHHAKDIVVHTGVTKLRSKIESIDHSLVDSVLRVHNRAITESFYISVVMAVLAFIAAWGVDWKSMRKGNVNHK